MPKSLLRSVAVLIIPWLIVDPSLARSVNQQTVAPRLAIFTQEALSLSPISNRRYLKLGVLVVAAGLGSIRHVRAFISKHIMFIGWFALTQLIMADFATNSILCRFAMKATEPELRIDPYLFTAIRAGSGMLMIWLITVVWGGLSKVLPNSISEPTWKLGGSWRSGFYLFIYMAAFSAVYLRLTAATGTLILFTFVHATMLIAGHINGVRLIRREKYGLLVALIGLVFLELFGLAVPPMDAFFLMALSGSAWGMYSLYGRGSKTPFDDTRGNFTRAAAMAGLFAIAAKMFNPSALHWSLRGALLGVVSGAFTSALGYLAWYKILSSWEWIRRKHGKYAAMVQLTVPFYAPIIGVFALLEPITTHVIEAIAVTATGLGIAFYPRKELKTSA